MLPAAIIQEGLKFLQGFVSTSRKLKRSFQNLLNTICLSGLYEKLFASPLRNLIPLKPAGEAIGIFRKG